MTPDVIVMWPKEVTEGLCIIFSEAVIEGITCCHTYASSEEGLERNDILDMKMLVQPRSKVFKKRLGWRDDQDITGLSVPGVVRMNRRVL